MRFKMFRSTEGPVAQPVVYVVKIKIYSYNAPRSILFFNKMLKLSQSVPFA